MLCAASVDPCVKLSPDYKDSIEFRHFVVLWLPYKLSNKYDRWNPDVVKRQPGREEAWDRGEIRRL